MRVALKILYLMSTLTTSWARNQESFLSERPENTKKTLDTQ